MRTHFVRYLCVLVMLFGPCGAWAQNPDVEFTLDVSSSTIPLPELFSPDIDLSGRGFSSELTWPQSLGAREVVNRWQKDIGFGGIYRLQYNLWEISQLEKNRQLQERLLANYESVIKKINDAGGIVILNIFSTPQGQGKVFDKKSSPVDLKAFKRVIKNYIRQLSCVKRYNIWYEVWTAPDLDVFFLGRTQDYLGLYRVVAESIRELEEETKINIPVGGPSTSWWFQNGDGNTIVTPERSLIYELIRFCRHYRLQLDFLSWHAYSTDPKAEKEMTGYNKTSIALIRDWLSYFNFPKDMPLIIDEWNFDSGTNMLFERKEKAHIGASFIPARLRHMYEADLSRQVFFSLEDFQDNKEGVARNVGAFWVEQNEAGYTGGTKVMYSVFKMLSLLGPELYISPSKVTDEFVGLIATKNKDSYAIMIFNYLDPDIFQNTVSRSIALLSEGERRFILGLAKSGGLEKIKSRQSDIAALRTSGKVKTLLKKALEAHDVLQRHKESPRQLKLTIKNVKQDYLYSRYSVDSSCSINCEFYPQEEKVLSVVNQSCSEKLALSPYSVHLLVLKPRPPEPEPPAEPQPQSAKAAEGAPSAVSLQPPSVGDNAQNKTLIETKSNTTGLSE